MSQILYDYLKKYEDQRNQTIKDMIKQQAEMIAILREMVARRDAEKNPKSHLTLVTSNP